MRPRPCDSCGTTIPEGLRCFPCRQKEIAWDCERCDYCGHWRSDHVHDGCRPVDPWSTSRRLSCESRCRGFEPTTNVPPPPSVRNHPSRADATRGALVLVCVVAAVLAFLLARS